MLTKDNYTLEHINELRKNKNTDTFYFREKHLCVWFAGGSLQGKDAVYI